VEGGREHAGGSILARAAPHERLIEQVSVETGIAFDRVKEVTEAFLAIVLERLAHDGAVTLNKIGRLWVSTRRDTRKNMERPGSPNLESLTHEGVQHRVVFRKSSALRQALNETRPKEIQMDKLGVDETVDEQVMEKAAHEGCPNCGAKVVWEGQVLICPNCGTEPFERKKRDVQG
jgi:nucleoid DNA-binding protein/predicted RNA-binding Zn-ribbon protein involved in translation (DUF1610 family)